MSSLPQKLKPQRLIPISAALICVALSGCVGPTAPLDHVSVDFVSDPSDLGTVQTNPLNIADAVRLSILSSNNVLNSRVSVRQRENDVLIARSALYPELYLNANPSTQDDVLATGAAGIRYTIYDFGARAAEIDAARQNIRGAQFQTVVETEETVMEVVTQYIDVAIDTAQAKASNALFKNIRSLEEGVKAHVDIGVASTVDVIEIETGRLKARAEIAGTDADLENSRDSLSSLVGLITSNVNDVSSISQDLETGTPVDTFPTEITEFPRVAALEQELAAAKSNLKATRAGLLPRIGAALGIGVNIGSGATASNTGIVAGPEISNTFSFGGGNKKRVENA